jgi:CRISPR-associated protein Cas2
MDHQPAAYLIAYDIASPRRLPRIHRCLSRCALWVQYSVFAGRFTPAAVTALAADLRALIHPALDDVRIYRLPSFARPSVIGASMWPQEVLLGGLLPAPLAAVTQSLTPAPPAPEKLASLPTTPSPSTASTPAPFEPMP